MKQLSVIILLLIFIGCDNDNAPDCLKTTGSVISKEIELADFNRILINNEFNVTITQAAEQRVILSMGENLIDDVSFDLNSNMLEITNNISCRWTRNYNFPTLEISHPNLEMIQIKGGSIITSNGTLTYPNLSFISEESNGNISLNINAPNLSIDSNEITNYSVSGSVSNLNLIYSSGNGRFEGADLMVNTASVKHSGSNEIIVNVVESLTGSINSTGDLIFVGQRPALIDVEINNRGQLIDRTN